MPKGWGNFEDLPGNFLLIPPGGNVKGVGPGTSDFVGVYTHVLAEASRCGGVASPHVGDSPADIATYLATDPDLKTTKPNNVSIGGLEGVVLDIQMAEDSRKDSTCLIVGAPPSGLDHGVSPGFTWRLYLLTPSVGTLAIEIDDVPGGGNHLDAYSAVVDDFVFEACPEPEGFGIMASSYADSLAPVHRHDLDRFGRSARLCRL